MSRDESWTHYKFWCSFERHIISNSTGILFVVLLVIFYQLPACALILIYLPIKHFIICHILLEFTARADKILMSLSRKDHVRSYVYYTRTRSLSVMLCCEAMFSISSKNTENVGYTRRKDRSWSFLEISLSQLVVHYLHGLVAILSTFSEHQSPSLSPLL